MTLNLKYSDEINILKEKGIFDEEDSVDAIHEVIYECPEWAEIFWRRRNQHTRRSDPEIPFIEKFNPKTVLEVGSAYGRVTKKILELQGEKEGKLSNLEVTGLEINPNFQNYLHKFTKAYPDLSKATFIFGSIFKTEEIFPETVFDIVVIPMNTVPNFPFTKLDTLFKNLRNIVKQKGHCIFSVHNHKIGNDAIQRQEDDLAGELLLEKGKKPIALVAYSFPLQRTHYGYSKKTYLIHHFLNHKICSERKIICRSVTEFVNSEILEDIITKNGFSIDFIDNKTFSKVYCIKKD